VIIGRPRALDIHALGRTVWVVKGNAARMERQMSEIYRGHEITREKIDGQVRWVVTQDGAIVYVTVASEDAALNWVDAYRKGVQWAVEARL
jgi:hypothetical protein